MTYSVPSLLRTMDKTDPQVFRVVGTKEVPDWRGVSKHFQGIAPINGVTRISGDISASADEAWFAVFHEGENPPAVVDAVWTSENYDHAGGIQRIGDLLPLPLENDRGWATVVFFHGTELLYEVGVPSGHKASAVAVTNYTDAAGHEQALLLVYRYDPKTFNIFQAPADSIAEKNWNRVGETNALSDDDQFQCFALVTQANRNGDQVYLLGFRESEHLVLYTVDTGSENFGQLTEVEMFKFEGSQWRYGVGLQIATPWMLRIFGCSEDPSGDRDDYEFPIYYWG
ncbi:MAG TPA: hypothetical protein DD490_27485 [Acidobacteria bacterium]|nr:hypothetical protein [Acidobacteriota bacterium]